MCLRKQNEVTESRLECELKRCVILLGVFSDWQTFNTVLTNYS